MCLPAVAVIASLVGTSISLYQQRQNVKAQERFQNQQHEQNTVLAQRAALLEYGAVSKRIAQEREAAAQAVEEGARRAIIAQGRLTTGAGEAGAASSGAFTRLVRDFARQESEYRSAILGNLSNRSEQLLMQTEQTRGQLAYRLLYTLPRPIQQPDYLGASLRAVGSAAATYAQYEAYKEGAAAEALEGPPGNLNP